MQITTPSSQEIIVNESVESSCPLRCPVCSGSLVPLNNSYRCSRCSRHLCAGCESVEPDTLNHPFG